MHSLIGAAIIAIAVQAEQILSALYYFIPEYPEVYRKCSDKPGIEVSDFVDKSHLDSYFDDKGVHLNGSILVTWDITQTDHVMMTAELKKFDRGTWQRTVFLTQIPDFCQSMMDITSFVYQGWSRHIVPEDLQCVGKGIRYRYEPFYVSVEISALVNMEGRYKFEIIFKAYDENGRLRPNVCVEMPGDIISL
uniref:MD-2-related lipid-recognition domain-containing protein n=1 Tax=Glossina brevipalpis TaxID=37001 RepID=A0A1A9WR51_9MUSC